jgi:hypothetical protein
MAMRSYTLYSVRDYLLSIAACILSGQSLRSYSQYKYIDSSVAFEM